MVKREFDWESIEREYRAGQLSVREIGRRFGISAPAILKAAERNGWSRDLTQRVQAAVRTKVIEAMAKEVPAAKLPVNAPVITAVTAVVNSPNAHKTIGQEEPIVQAAAQRGAEVHLSQQTSARQGRQLVDQLKTELESTTRRLAEVEAAIVEETANDQSAERRKAMFRAVSLPTRAGVIRDLAQAEVRYIQLERQLYRLDESNPYNEYEAALRRLHDSGALS